MKHPENLKLCGKQIILTSYKREHVPKYHEWMEDDEILRLTASERLTLDEEYAMQQDWENDDKKCTFIIQLNSDISSMIGDTNLFLGESGTAEIEVMIAEKSARRQGFAKDALQLMMEYATTNLNIHTFFAKIKSDNEGSIKLFEQLGYIFQSKNDIFDEVCYSYSCPNS